MRISKNSVLDFLTKCQIENGGYTGGDVAELAKSLPVSPQALRKRINYWITNAPAFKQLRYLGKQFVDLTIDDFVLINQRLKEKPLGRMSDIIRELNDNRQEQGKEPIPQSTFYRFVTSRKESLTAQQELQWLILYGINVADTYNLANARASLSTVFSYTDLKTFGGIDIEGIASRLQEAQKCFQQTYPGADPFEWFPRIRLRSKVIRNHLSRIKANESLADQALLIFEAQVDFIVRLKDILIEELIHKMGWIQRSKDGNRFKFCAGNAHTVSRVAAGLAFTGHRVILLGRYPHPATRPGEICLSRLRKHLEFSWLKLQIDKSVWSGLWSVVLRG